MSEIDDRELAALLLARALVEIRYLAASAQQTPEENPPADALDRIRFLADLVHNMPLITTPSTRRPARRKAPSRQEQAMQARPMSWTWNTCGPDGRAWITQHIEHLECRWTLPPPPPTPRTGVPALTMRQRDIGIPSAVEHAHPYHSETQRRTALPRWLHTYNHHRGHTALNGQPPASRVPNLPRQYSWRWSARCHTHDRGGGTRHVTARMAGPLTCGAVGRRAAQAPGPATRRPPARRPARTPGRPTGR